jgi:hypothetical protein
MGIAHGYEMSEDLFGSPGNKVTPYFLGGEIMYSRARIDRKLKAPESA